MKVPKSIQNTHIRFDDKPYPCGYCYHYTGCPCNIDEKGLDKRIVESFVNPDDADYPTTCMAGLNGPTGFGKCDSYYPIAMDCRTHCIPDVFTFLESDYMMYVMSKVYEEPGIAMKSIIDRGSRGYNTRLNRVKQLIERGYIESIEDVHGDAILFCTATGDRLATAIRALYDDMVLIQMEQDVLEDSDISTVFQIILEAGEADSHKIYAEAHEKGIPLEIAYTAREKLVDSGHIRAEYDYQWDAVYKATPRGIRQWNRKQSRTEQGTSQSD